MKKHWIVYSPAFHPLLGGIETVVRVLATEWSRAGIEVTVITKTPSDEPDRFPFKVLRRASLREQIRTYRSADAAIHANVSLWGILPFLFCGCRRPAWIATHHGWYENFGQKIKPLDRLKKFLARYPSANISVSLAVDRFLGLKGHVIPNPYDSSLFRIHPEVERNRDLVFLGRLVSDKGCDILLDALALLREAGVSLSLTIVGSGPEHKSLESQVTRLDLGSQVHFAGPQSGEPLARLLNAHKAMVVPSRWNEPFGIVALEGAACGCFVIGSNGGGLPEAIGPCGETFTNNDTKSLTDVLAKYFLNTHKTQTNTLLIEKHLQAHLAKTVSLNYISLIDSAIGKSGNS